MFSYWEQQSFSSYDHIIVGAGIVGLSTAIELRSRFPGARILVLERGLLPTGASSRNAGFACMGSVTELLDDLGQMDEIEVFALFERRKKGLERLRNRLGDARIGYQERGSYELIGEEELPALEQIDYLNNLLLPLTEKPAFAVATEKLEAFGFSKQHTKALIENTCEGELHTGKMLRALTDAAIEAGVEIKTGVNVQGFEEDKDQVVTTVHDGFRQHEWRLQSQSLCLCTNAFTRELLPEVDVRPGRGQVLITRPVPGLRLKGIFHYDKGYYYFRELEGRVLLGGGRNLDFEGEATTDFSLSERIQKELEHKLREVILPGRSFEVDQRWTGIMAFGPTKQPVVQPFSHRVYGAFRMGGMGVALGSEVAMRIADIMADRLR